MLDNFRMTGEGGINSQTGRQSQEQRSAVTKEKLLEGAFQVLRDKGHAGLRSANISEASGVSRGGLLHHYATKELLCAAVHEWLLDRMEGISLGNVAAATDERLLEAIVEDAKQRFFGEEYRVALDILIASRESAVDIGSAANVPQRMDSYVAWADRLSQTGVAPSIALHSTAFLWTMVRGLAIRSFVDQNGEHDRRVISFSVRMIRAFLEANPLP